MQSAATKYVALATVALALLTSAAAALDDDESECAYADFDLANLLRAVRAMF